MSTKVPGHFVCESSSIISKRLLFFVGPVNDCILISKLTSFRNGSFGLGLMYNIPTIDWFAVVNSVTIKFHHLSWFSLLLTVAANCERVVTYLRNKRNNVQKTSHAA